MTDDDSVVSMDEFREQRPLYGHHDDPEQRQAEDDAAMMTLIIAELQDIGERWPDGYTLFSNSGTLIVCETSRLSEVHNDDLDVDHAIIATIDGIVNDGGQL